MDEIKFVRPGVDKEIQKQNERHTQIIELALTESKDAIREFLAHNIDPSQDLDHVIDEMVNKYVELAVHFEHDSLDIYTKFEQVLEELGIFFQQKKFLKAAESEGIPPRFVGLIDILTEEFEKWLQRFDEAAESRRKTPSPSVVPFKKPTDNNE